MVTLNKIIQDGGMETCLDAERTEED
jgi:hypothetical protein